jgi:hypothetical protein
MKAPGGEDVQLPSFLTLALDCKWPTLPLWKKLRVPNGYVAEWALEQMQMLWTKEKFPGLPGI